MDTDRGTCVLSWRARFPRCLFCTRRMQRRNVGAVDGAVAEQYIHFEFKFAIRIFETVRNQMMSSPRKKSNNNSQSELKREAAFRGASAPPSGQRKKKKSGVSSSEKNTVQSLAKGFRVLETFTAQEPELTMAEVARLAGIDNATAFRFLNTLVEIGYVDRVADTRKFRLALKVLDLGFNAIAQSDLRTHARPILRGLVGEINEAA